jgi:hypothetical protein
MNAIEQWYFSERNFLIVARGIFKKGDLKLMRESIIEKSSNSNYSQTEQKKIEKFGIASDQIRLNEEWFQPFQNATLSKLKEVVPEFNQITFPPMIRAVKNLQSFVPWHQDSKYVSDARGISGHDEIITCFVPLNENPDDHPSLEFSLNPNQGIVNHIVREGITYNKYDLPKENYPVAEDCFRPTLSLGDALIFGMDTLHRTFSLKTSFKPRYSVEYRITKLSQIKVGKDYYDIFRQSFYHNKGE